MTTVVFGTMSARLRTRAAANQRVPVITSWVMAERASMVRNPIKKAA